MSSAVSIRQRVEQLRKLQADLPNILSNAAREATQRAVEATMDATPPKSGGDRLPGVNIVTGELKAHWETDSVTEPQKVGSGYVTFLANDMEYASYVNNGHRMDRHFVPGLYVDENGQLNYDPAAKVGLVVGTKTTYVKGEFMVDKGKETYQKAVEEILDGEIRRLAK